MSARNGHTGEYNRRKYVLPLAVATTLLVLGAFIGVSYWLSVFAAHKATENTLSIKIFCEQVNSSRAKQVGIWQFLLHLGNGQPPPGTTKAQYQLEVNRFEAFLKKTYAPRDCSVPFNVNK